MATDGQLGGIVVVVAVAVPTFSGAATGPPAWLGRHPLPGVRGWVGGEGGLRYSTLRLRYERSHPAAVLHAQRSRHTPSAPAKESHRASVYATSGVGLGGRRGGFGSPDERWVATRWWRSNARCGFGADAANAPNAGGPIARGWHTIKRKSTSHRRRRRHWGAETRCLTRKPLT
jgi:hypothetical protein